MCASSLLPTPFLVSDSSSPHASVMPPLVRRTPSFTFDLGGVRRHPLASSSRHRPLAQWARGAAQPQPPPQTPTVEYMVARQSHQPTGQRPHAATTPAEGVEAPGGGCRRMRILLGKRLVGGIGPAAPAAAAEGSVGHPRPHRREWPADRPGQRRRGSDRRRVASPATATRPILCAHPFGELVQANRTRPVDGSIRGSKRARRKRARRHHPVDGRQGHSKARLLPPPPPPAPGAGATTNGRRRRRRRTERALPLHVDGHPQVSDPVVGGPARVGRLPTPRSAAAGLGRPRRQHGREVRRRRRPHVPHAEGGRHGPRRYRHADHDPPGRGAPHPPPRRVHHRSAIPAAAEHSDDVAFHLLPTRPKRLVVLLSGLRRPPVVPFTDAAR
ncbi:hypothetical protein BU14_0148s0006 [Porphyra umbilicalis]|uniref:Uncharacterized protein n=1 Tax=Porphyra umbilicalis TaxID=2786 RepID=A0A1X6P9I6_PORUM|nr:hypothetical protein BU14_0148s0006 [Porphyra umbilicalis]|eukprot:OSX77430.1 hypothetical protein BU14_0148s0006 [Porphyra umbilicalis]